LQRVLLPVVTGHASFLGAVMSEQAARAKETITVAARRSLRRIMGKLLKG